MSSSSASSLPLSLLGRTLSAGVPRYGCVVNPQKVAVNFPLEEGVSFPGVRVLPQHCLFPWCGLLLDTQTLDVYNDYSRLQCPSLSPLLPYNKW